MYLKHFKISNFRKFGEEENVLNFVDAKSNQNKEADESINVASTTTLIVGKNNSGKTSVISALEKLLKNSGAFKANDFNFSYLKKLLIIYQTSTADAPTPKIEFNIGIGIDDDGEDLVTNLVPFMMLDDVSKSELEIIAKFELEDEKIFLKEVKDLTAQYQDNINLFRKFLELINNSSFKLNYYDANEEHAKNFNINSLIELTSIKANNVRNENSLSSAFGKIINYQNEVLLKDGRDSLESQMMSINDTITESIQNSHTDNINTSLARIDSSSNIKMHLSADLNFNTLMTNLIKYEYIERDNNIPENQFGLGYTNLMMIIADIIDYMEKYPTDAFNSKINLISIEEPETFMHPQMQELFIKNINDAIASLLKNKKKNINSQLIITTHSSHILNSKIHTGNTFNNINYITTSNYNSHVINLSDDKIVPTATACPVKKLNDLNFLKKHVKYKVSELFFSDAVIFVEGITEETILKYYIDQCNTLNKQHISIFNIDGSHGLVYHHLIKLLNVPTLIITDLDIKRDENEKNKYCQIDDLTKRITTNETIIKYNSKNRCLSKLPSHFEVANIFVTYQGIIEGFYATSFEEAFILTNYSNELLNEVLLEMKPDIYKSIIGDDRDFLQLKNNSYKLQRKLSNSKSNFSNSLLYKLLASDEETNHPSLPTYIESGLSWLEDKLGEGKKV